MEEPLAANNSKSGLRFEEIYTFDGGTAETSAPVSMR